MAGQITAPQDLTHALGALREPWQVLDARGPRVRGHEAALLVGPPGVFVVVSAPAPRGRALDKLLSALVEAGASPAPRAGVRRDEVHPVLCVSGEEYVDAWRHGVALCAPVALGDNLEHRRARLSDVEVVQVGRRLEAALSGGGRHRALRRG